MNHIIFLTKGIVTFSRDSSEIESYASPRGRLRAFFR